MGGEARRGTDDDTRNLLVDPLLIFYFILFYYIVLYYKFCYIHLFSLL